MLWFAIMALCGTVFTGIGIYARSGWACSQLPVGV